VCPQKVAHLNDWLWQVQICTALHIIKHAKALMNLECCHQILYKSTVPFSRFSIFTKCCQKVQLPAAVLTCFLCALIVFCFVLTFNIFPVMVSVGISFFGRTKLWFVPARRYASAGNSDRNVSVRPSVCLSVCPSVTRLSRAGIVSKRRKLAAWFLDHLVAPRL